MPLSLSKQDAKRIAIRAQGLASARPDKPIVIDDVQRSIRAMNLLQIDAVNVCVRSHYMPLFSRLGSYDQNLLDELVYDKKSVFETWAHAACFAPVEDHRLFRPRMAAQKPRRHVAEIMKERPGYLEGVLDQVRENVSRSCIVKVPSADALQQLTELISADGEVSDADLLLIEGPHHVLLNP